MLTSLALAACSSGMGDLSSVGIGASTLGYQHSNAVVMSGYSETQVAPDRYRIEVKGPLATPRERLEKIAATRAAEIGRDNNLGYFKIEGTQISSYCKTYTAGGQRGGTGTEKKKLEYAVLTADVAYTKSPPDASYVQSKAVFDQYRAEVDMPLPAGVPTTPTGATCG